MVLLFRKRGHGQKVLRLDVILLKHLGDYLDEDHAAILTCARRFLEGLSAEMVLTKWLKSLSWRSVFLAIVISAILSGILTLSSSIYVGDGWLSLSLVELMPQFLLLIALFAFLLLGCLFLFDLREMWDDSPKRGGGLLWRICVPEWQASRICISATVMLICWLPWLLAFYPASMNWDTYYQIAMFSGETPVWAIPYAPTGSIVDHAFSDYHPLFDTLIFGAFARLGQIVTGDWNLGIFLYILIQSAGMAISLAASVSLVGKKGCPKLLLAGVFIFFAIMPFIPAYAGTIVKDTLFSWLYIPYFLLVFEVVDSRGEAAKNRNVAVLLVVLGLLLCLTKKTGPYVVIPTAIVLMLIYRKEAVCFIVQAGLSAVLMWVLLPHIVFPALDVVPGGKQESLATLFQQTARYALDYPDDVTQQEKDAIDAVIGYDNLAARYDWQTADPVKNWYRYDAATDADVSEYLKTWCAQGMRHPDSYLVSILATSGRYFSGEGTIALHEDTADVEHGGTELLSRPEVFAPLRGVLLEAYHAIAGLPVVGILFSVALYAFYIPMTAFFVMLCRRRDLLPLLIPALLCIASCVITPVFHARYALPLLYTSPLLLCMLVTRSSVKGVRGSSASLR